MRRKKKKEHKPAVNNGDISFFILTDDTKSVSFEVSRGSHHWRWGCFGQRIVPRMRLFPVPVLTSLLLFTCVYRGLSCAFLTLVTEQCLYTCDKITFFK